MAKMKAYASFAAYLSDQVPKHRAILRKLRTFVLREAPTLEESVKWGNGCWLQDGQPLVYVYCAADHLQFGFLCGSSLNDPCNLLQGNAQFVRHIKLRKPQDLDEDAFRALLLQALRIGSPRKTKKARSKA